MHSSHAGSPFTVKVTGEGRIKESITRKRQASSIASVGSTCGLNLKIPGETRGPSEVVRRQRSTILRLMKLIHTHICILTALSSLQETGSRWFRLRRGWPRRSPGAATPTPALNARRSARPAVERPRGRYEWRRALRWAEEEARSEMFLETFWAERA